METLDTAVSPCLLESVSGGVAHLTLNRPGQFNALSAALIAALQQAFDRLRVDRTVKVIVLSAHGRGFCSGHDLKEIRALAALAEVEELFASCSRMMMTIGELPQPVIARVHGTATAAGCQLVAACDLAIGASDSRYATPGVNLGTFCSTPSVALGRTVHPKHAMELLLTGDMISAARAAEIGLINRAVAPELLVDEVDALAHRIASKSAAAIATGKRVFRAHMAMDLEAAYRFAGHAIATEFLSAEGREGVDAFLEKRPPHWQ